MIFRVLLGVGLVAAVGSQARADRHSATVLTSVGSSTATTRRVANLAPPSLEVRYSYEPSALPRFAFDGGLAAIIFPETIPEARFGARLYPLRSEAASILSKGLFVRLGAQALLDIDGFDYAPNTEIGLAAEASQLIGFVGASVSRYMRNPRVVTELRLGVGISF